MREKNKSMAQVTVFLGRWAAAILATAVFIIGCVFGVDRHATETLVFLGNSITQMDSLPQKGWNQVWGMAATAKDKDYVHQTLGLLAARGVKARAVIGDRDCAICEGPIDAHAENARAVVWKWRPLAVVVQLGENSSAIEVGSGELTAEYRRLLREITEAGAKRVYALSVWNDTSLTAPRTLAVQRAAREFSQVRFVDLTDIPKHTGNYGDSSVYADADVLWHPGDAGMRAMAEILAEAILEDL